MSDEFLNAFELSKTVTAAPAPSVPDKRYETELTQKFITRYKTTFENINSKLLKVYQDDKGFHIPVPTLQIQDNFGFTDIPNSEGAFQLNRPAKMITKNILHQEIKYVLRIVIPYAKADEVLNDEAFFNEFFDSLINSAYTEVVKRYGTPKYGSVVMDYSRPGTNLVFSNNTSAEDEGFEMRFYGNFAGKVL